MAASEGQYRAVVVIGPSGNGKSTLGQAIAQRLGWRFVEGDDHHPPENIAKMTRGEPLTDDDRVPFLTSIGQALAAGESVAACSALKRGYRGLLVDTAGLPVLFVLPHVAKEELQRRMEQRPGHFMPASMLHSQLATFERPAPGENCLTLDGTMPPTQFADAVADCLTSGKQP